MAASGTVYLPANKMKRKTNGPILLRAEESRGTLDSISQRILQQWYPLTHGPRQEK